MTLSIQIDGASLETSGAVVVTEKVAQAIRCCVVGHSIAFGGSAAGNEGYKCYLADLMVSSGLPWANVGSFANGGGVTQSGSHPHNAHSAVSGDQILDVDARWATDVTPHSPTDVILDIGTNDAGVGVSTMLSRMSTLLETAYSETPNIRLWVVKQGYRVNHETAVTDFDNGLAAILAASSWSSSQYATVPRTTYSWLYADGVHLSTAGHYVQAARLFDAMYQELRP